MLTSSRHIASGLLARGLSAEKPVVILSGNSIDHALIAFGALYAGIPFCPVSPAYSLVSKDYGKLSYLMKLLTPGLIFADDADKFADALQANVPAGVEIAAAFGALPGRDVTMLADLMATPLHGGLDAVHQAIGPDTIAKFLLTSGSTGNPKAVINTQRMLCANQVMIRETMAFLKDEPPVIVDWLPWNHTFGGNHNIGLVLYNGGSMYLDAGKPMPGGIEETVRNLREVSPTVYFNVPKGYESLLPYLRDDAALREKFFGRLHAMFFSGAALSPFVWNSLDELSVQATGSRVPMLTGLGATESGAVLHVGQSPHQPFRPYRASRIRQRCQAGSQQRQAGGSRQGPERHAGLLAAAGIDREGLRRGRLLQVRRCHQAGRSERFRRRLRFRRPHRRGFQIASGTWVSVGPLRARFIAACAPLVRDVVIAGINRDEISAIVVLDLDGCRLINPTTPIDDLALTAADPADPRGVSRALHEVPGDLDRFVDADHPRGAARFAAVDRPRRGHRQGLDQPARGARCARRPDRTALCAGAAGPRDNALTEFETPVSPKGGYHAVEGSGRHRHRRRIGIRRRHRAQARGGGRQGRRVRPQRQTRRKPRRRDQGRRGASATLPMPLPRKPPSSPPSKAHGPARVLVNCAGIGVAKRVVGRDGPMPLADFERVIKVNLIGSFNMLRLAAAEMAKLEPQSSGERGVIISTALGRRL